MESSLQDLVNPTKLISQDEKSLICKASSGSGWIGLQITPDISYGVEQLDALQNVKEVLLDSKKSPAFLRCDSWVISRRIPQIDQLGATSIQNYGADTSHMYLFTNTIDTSLLKLNVQPTQYEVKCLFFELIYAVIVLGINLPGIIPDLKIGNLLLVESSVDRVYKVGQEEFRVCSQYLPIIAKFSHKDSVIDLEFLLDNLVYFCNSKVDLSEIFVRELVQLGELIKRGEAVFQASFFDDLRPNSSVTLALQRPKYLDLVPL